LLCRLARTATTTAPTAQNNDAPAKKRIEKAHIHLAQCGLDNKCIADIAQPVDIRPHGIHLLRPHRGSGTSTAARASKIAIGYVHP